MKKKTLLVLCFSMMLAAAACGKDNKENTDNSNVAETTPTPAVSKENNNNNNEDESVLDNPVVKKDYDFNDYIKLGAYKGLEVKVNKLDVRDEDIDIAIQLELYDSDVTPVEVTDRPVQMSDTVTIDFVGYHNGEPFEGGSGEDYDLTIGSGAFIKGFEEQIIGAKLNDEIEVNVVFPEEYFNDKLAGEPALFKVTVKSIKYYELTEEFVKNAGFDTIEAYRESMYQELISSNEEAMQKQKKNNLYNAVIDGSEITLPENLLEYYTYEYKFMYESMASAYGMDLDTMLALSGYSKEEFEAEAELYANSMATRELITKAISAAEGIELTEEEINNKVSELAEEYGYESNEEFLEAADIEVIKDDMLFNKVIDIIVANSIEI